MIHGVYLVYSSIVTAVPQVLKPGTKQRGTGEEFHMPYIYLPSNKNASVRSRQTKNNKSRTETHRRDDGTMNVAITTSNKGQTRLFIDLPDTSWSFNGREARTIYRVLERHFQFTGKPVGA